MSQLSAGRAHLGTARTGRKVPDQAVQGARAGLGLEVAAECAGSAVWLSLVGALDVYRGGRLLESTEVGSRKARRLLALLAVHRDRLIAVGRIVDVLWDAGPPRQAADNVATLVSRLRRALGSEIIVGGRSGYRLNDAVGDDLHDAAMLVGEAEASLASDPPRALASAQRALGLLGVDDVLTDEPDSTWADRARAWHTRLLQRTRHCVAHSALRINDLRSARAAAQAALDDDPLDEAAARLLMRVHDAADEPARALLVFEQVRATLARQLGTDPAPATRDLHVEILRNPKPVPAGPDHLAPPPTARRRDGPRPTDRPSPL